MKRAIALVALAACSKTTSQPGFKDGADGLKALFVASQAACHAKDFAKGRAIVSGLLPTADALKKALRDDTPPDLADKVIGLFQEMPSDDEKLACLFSPDGRTEIQVHASTTEEIAAYADGSVAFTEFPGGAKRLAETALRPQTVFYEVEAVEPGKDRGTKFHMFFWDGARWQMLGPAWRVL